ncbi:hypothetical protein [Streptomyces sp. NBC_00728]|uniref:hypothetical protein n=1 Tax=Streptomyces sp. NBC_00728 TaxID=2903676 RepID=UPI00386FBC38
MPDRTNCGPWLGAVHERTASLLLDVRSCHRVLGAADAFTRYLTDLRAELKRRRKPMTVLDGHGR